jgi:phospholipase C
LTIRSFRTLPGVALALAGIILQPALVNAQSATPAITIAPFTAPVPSYVIQPSAEVTLTQAQKLALVQQKIKYVFVLFQENRAFDFYFGSYPGANGLYQNYDGSTATPAGYNSPFVNTQGQVTTIHPFKIPTSVVDANNHTVLLYPEDLASTDHSHAGMNKGIHYVNGSAMNDGYALDNEGITVTNGVPSATPTLAAEQMGEVAMSHIDCDVAGFLWNYADRFTLFDNFHQTIIGPSTPNAIAMIAGQSGETQWVEHPNLASNVISTNFALPIVADPDPYWGSSLAPTPQPEPGHTASPASNLTFATLPLSFMGNQINAITAQDLNPAFDLIDVQADIEKIASHRVAAVNWGWYQQGYDEEPNQTPPIGPNTADGAAGGDYIAHHNGPQYFGYVANNPASTSNLHGLGDFYTAINNHTLPAAGGVFYVRGGYNNIDNLVPVGVNANEKVTYAGNDDHPGYSDSQISEALLADSINAIANSPYWSQSAIIISYDETDGEYDHGAIVNRELDPEGNPLAQGPRIPTLLISPYGVVHGVDHMASEHSSIIKFIDELHNLIPLADLPDELKARQTGLMTYGQANLGPADDLVSGVSDMLDAFDNNRLTGNAAPLPASYAIIPTATVQTLPHYNNQGCSVLGITPTDANLPNPVPADFNPRPSTAPGIPTSGTWVP